MTNFNLRLIQIRMLNNNSMLLHLYKYTEKIFFYNKLNFEKEKIVTRYKNLNRLNLFHLISIIKILI